MLEEMLSKMDLVFSVSQLKQGQTYQQEGHILELRIADGLLKARVRGNSNALYHVYIDMRDWPQIPARCTCTVHRNCKHAAACLYAWFARSEHGIGTELLKRQTTRLSAPKLLTADDYSTSHTEVLPENIIFVDQAQWFSKRSEDQKNHFFSYHLGILVEGEAVDILPLIVECIDHFGKGKLESLSDSTNLQLPLTKGRVLQIELGRIKPFINFLMQYGLHRVQQQSVIKLSTAQLILMREVEQAILASSKRWLGTKKLRSQLEQLMHSESLPIISPPKGLTAQLRDYQQLGLNWLQFLRKNNFGGLLADDMGLGKTVQTLAHLQVEKEANRLKKASLIIAPTSLLSNWSEEIKRFTNLKALVFHGTKREENNFDDYEVIISSYGLLDRDKPRFVNYFFYYVILDEGQWIKNTRTKLAQIVQQLSAQHRLCLSGTPFENHLGELWSLFHFLMPGLLGHARHFKKNFKDPIEQDHDLECKKKLLKLLQPFLLRRTKDEVAKELPKKTEIIREVALGGAQRDLYEMIRISMEKKVRDAISKQGLNRSHIVFLDALLKLRQVCCDPRLLSMSEAEMAYGVSEKLVVLMELLEDLIEEGRCVLVFSQFTSMLKLIEDELKQRNYPYLKLTGRTKDRGKVVHRFQTGEVPIFLISLKAGGAGLNLTRADTVIHYDPWWNPAAEQQATDRSHRIGQDNPVFVYKLITQGTVEEAILAMQKKKQKLFESILMHDNSYGINKLTMEDINEIFESSEQSPEE